MGRPLRVIASVAAAMFLASAGAMVYMATHRSDRSIVRIDPESGSALDDLVVPSFALTDQDGRPVTRDALLGQVTILDFVFTNCPTACPLMAEKMVELNRSLLNTDVRFMSISVDGNHDTPEVLREYGKRYGADFNRWTFLTGDPDAVRGIIVDGLKYLLEEDRTISFTYPSGEQGFNIKHPTWFLLIGPDAKVRGLYPCSQPSEMERLVAEARELDAKNRQSATQKP